MVKNNLSITPMEENYSPLVSIALITSKSEKFIHQQIDSLLNQTYKNLEVVISHDECGDGTVNILNDYVSKDFRVRWMNNPNGKGFINNIQNAIAMCKGEIIFLCDHDDVWYETKVEEHVACYQDKKVAWVYNKPVLTNEHNEKIGYLEDRVSDYFTRERMSLMNYAWGSCIGGAHTSYRSKLIHNAMPVPALAPAHDTWIQLCIYPKKAVFIDKVLQEYRQHSNQETGWGHVHTTEESKKREVLSIENNMKFLKYLPTNKSLSIWKRCFYLCAYNAKVLRAIIRKLFH